jgi:hypothetical protein
MIRLGLKTADGLLALPIGFNLISVFVRFAASIAYSDVIRVVILNGFIGHNVSLLIISNWIKYDLYFSTFDYII